MLATMPIWCLTSLAHLPGRQADWPQAIGPMLEAGLELVTFLLAFLLAIFVLLVFAVRTLMIARGLPVPIDPLDMAKPKGFRGLMIGFAALLTPLVVLYVLPIEALTRRWPLAVAYGFDLLLAAALWFTLELFYKSRDRRSSNQERGPSSRGRRSG